MHIREHGVTAEGDLVHGPGFMSLWMLIITNETKKLFYKSQNRRHFQQRTTEREKTTDIHTFLKQRTTEKNKLQISARFSNRELLKRKHKTAEMHVLPI